MKVKQETQTFQPITITLETREDVFVVLAALNSVTAHDYDKEVGVCKGTEGMDGEALVDKSYVLWEKLQKLGGFSY